jgi:uncharacterized protein (TIGR00369 family)
MDEAHARGLERVYRAAPVNRLYDPEIQVGDGRAEISIPVNADHFHGGGALHGAVLFKLLDDAAFFAANAKVRERLVLTTSFHVHFLRPVVGGRLTATGRVVTRSRKLLVAEARIADDRGREVARGSGTFLPGGPPLAGLPGYRDAS